MGKHRLYVDSDECEANAVCVGIAPHLFDLDDDEVLHVLVEFPTDVDVDLAQTAVDSCPKRALFLQEVDE